MQLLKTFLRDKHLLIVLDNFEQVLPAAPHLSDLLSSCPQLKILVTSRALLHVWGEYTFRVPPLEVPDLQQLPELESLSQIASIALFVQRAEAILPGFQLNDENAHDIAEICTRLEGVPLALELAAAHCHVLSPHTLLSRLEHPIQMLTGGRRDAPRRHQTLRNMLSWNDDLLSPEEHKLFRRLAIFDGGFSLQAAEAVLSVFGDMSISVLDGITALIDKSMVQQSAYGEEEPRLYLFEILREYGLELLTACGELEQTLDAHAAYFMTLAEAAVFHTNHAALQALLECEVGNLRSALKWLLECGQGEKALRIVATLEQTSMVSREDNDLISAQVKARMPEVANYQVFNQFDLDLTDMRFEEYIHQNRQRHDQQEVVINLIYIDNITPLRRNRAEGSKELLSSSAYSELTTREIEVLRLLAMGLSNKQIAERLVLSPHTVSGHIQSIFGKLALNSRSAATRFALEHHLA
jgi:predicted ATPase/DNA-binding CsgD family transcriptional regulator